MINKSLALQLRIRVASLKPGTVLALEVTVEVIIKPWKYIPIRLTNGNSLSLMVRLGVDSSPSTPSTLRVEGTVPHRRTSLCICVTG